MCCWHGRAVLIREFLKAIARLMSELESGEYITVSRCLVPQIRRFADEGLQVRLAISLHAATDEERAALLPVNKRYPLAELIDACKYYIEKTGRRVTFEWALIAGKNDTAEQAQALGRLLNGLLCHVNPFRLILRGVRGRPLIAGRQRLYESLSSYVVPATIRGGVGR